jgi:hypothetical protein
MTRRLIPMACWLLLVTVWTAFLSDSAVAAPSGDCPTVNDFCIEDETGIPGRPATPVTDGGERGGSAGGGGGPVCVWKQSGVAGPAGQGDGGPFSEVVGTPSPGVEFYAEVCDGVYTGRVAWVPAGDPTPAAPLPAPEQLASVIRVRLEGSLPAPVVSSTPVAGVAAIVGYPSFVSVVNWSGVVRDRECDPTGLLCVTVTATPAMRWSPGEPDAAAQECQGPGVAFDPEGPAPEVQAAAPGACAYAYKWRTGVEGRPPHWPGVVAVEWALAWESSLGGGGSLPSVSKSAPVGRAVNEVQTVVVSAGE